MFECLQPLMVCFSLCGTTKLIDKLSEDHDVDVLFWSDNFKEAIKVYTYLAYYNNINLSMDCSHIHSCYAYVEI